MNIKYYLGDETFSFRQDSPKHINRISSLLTNQKGDYLNLGINKNYCKFQGLNIVEKQTMDVFKILDEIVINSTCENIEVTPSKISREFHQVTLDKAKLKINSKSLGDKYFGESGKLEYNDEGELVEVLNDNIKVSPKDYFFLGPTGGFIYEIKDFNEDIYIDLDCHKLNDFDEWGRDYQVELVDNKLIVKYTKKKDDKKEYTLYFGLLIDNLKFDLIKDFIEKEYQYSKERNSGFQRYVYRLLKVTNTSFSRLVCGAGFSQKEVIDQIDLLKDHEEELIKFTNEMFKDIIPKFNFEFPLNQSVDVAYKLSAQAMYKFLNKDLESHVKNGCFAGYPWFAQVWSRDDLIATRGLIELNEDQIVRDKFFSYFNLIDEETGLLPILSTKGSFSSPDSCFWLARRVEDFIYSLDERNLLDKYLTSGELKIIYKKLNLIFNRVIKNNWDSQKELIKVKDGDSWMDTIPLTYPLDIQVQFIAFVSTLADLSAILHESEDTKRFLDLEDSLKHRIRSSYFRDGKLYNEISNEDVTSNVFLAYYLYPNLFLREDWELIFDKTLREIRTHWGGVSTLSRKHPDFKDEYSGENNISYHRGDSWFWINNIVAIVLNDINEKKYRRDISKIVQSSTQDILKMGTLGFGSEISSAKNQLAQGAQAQLWSSSTYIEMVHKLFGKK